MAITTPEKRKAHLHGLALAVRKIQQEEEQKAKQLELFNNLKPEDTQFKM